MDRQTLRVVYEEVSALGVNSSLANGGLPPSRYGQRPYSSKPILKRAGLPHTVRFHDLKHTCATLLCSKNVNPKVAQEMLGHANISQTMDIYSHVLPNMQDVVTAAMESALT